MYVFIYICVFECSSSSGNNTNNNSDFFQAIDRQFLAKH